MQVIDTFNGKVIDTFAPGRAILHMEFAPKGEEVWISARDDNKVVIYDTRTRQKKGELPAASPSGIFFTSRAFRTGF
jgi:protein NirF